MNSTNIAVGAVALIIGLGIGYAAHEGTPVISHEMSDGTVMSGSDMNDAMDAMTMSLSGKSGDAFDQAFLSEMIVHHEGAVDMAEAALVSAKHDELKAMARAIITAQTKEIAQMQEWQRTWYDQ